MNKRWFFTKHALKRMSEMDVSRQEVFDALTDPDLDYPAQGNYPGQRTAVAGRIAVAYNDEVIVTILWRATNPYDRATHKPKAVAR